MSGAAPLTGERYVPYTEHIRGTTKVVLCFPPSATHTVDHHDHDRLARCPRGGRGKSAGILRGSGRHLNNWRVRVTDRAEE